MNLEIAAQSMLEQFPAADRSGLNSGERRLEKFGAFTFGGFLVVIALGVLSIST